MKIINRLHHRYNQCHRNSLRQHRHGLYVDCNIVHNTCKVQYSPVSVSCTSKPLFYMVHLQNIHMLEVLLVDIHTIIHANDTILLSTDRNKFIKKCNEMMNFFHANGLSLNLDKSGYMIINPKEHDLKTCIILQSGVLKYKSVIEYLGVFVTDIASLKNDIKLYVDKKRANVSIKFTNFCKKNRNAPLHVKLDVLDTCVTSALTYGCETWGRYVNEAELCYRSGLKTALNVRQNVNNEIVYIESGKWPLQS